MEAGKISGSPDHRKLSDHSEPEAMGLSQDLFHEIREQGSYRGRRVQGEVEITLLAILPR